MLFYLPQIKPEVKLFSYFLFHFQAPDIRYNYLIYYYIIFYLEFY